NNRPPAIAPNSAVKSAQTASRSSSTSCRNPITCLCFCISKILPTKLQNELSPMESFGVARRRVALNAAKAQVAAKQVRIEPLAIALRREALEKGCDFQVDRRRRQRTIHSGLRQIPVVFRDFVFQDRLTAKRIPGQLGNYAMILVPVGE